MYGRTHLQLPSGLNYSIPHTFLPAHPLKTRFMIIVRPGKLSEIPAVLAKIKLKINIGLKDCSTYAGDLASMPLNIKDLQYLNFIIF